MSVKTTQELSEKVEDSTKFIPESVVTFPGSTVKTASEYIWACFKDLGIYPDDEVSLEVFNSPSFKKGDARTVFCDRSRLPVPRFNMLWETLKEEGEVSETSSSTSGNTIADLIKSQKPIGQTSNKDLLSSVSAGDDNSEASEDELRKRYNGQRCIAIEVGTANINVDLSASLISKVRKGIAIPEVIQNEGTLYKICPVGVYPTEKNEICPITGEILFEGYCESLDVTYTVPIEIRRFFWVLKQNGVNLDKITIDNLQEMKNGISLDKLKHKFPKAGLMYSELEEANQLPLLIEAIGVSTRKVQDPLNVGRNMRW